MSAETRYWRCRVCGAVLQTDARPDVDALGYGLYPPDEDDPPLCEDCIERRDRDIATDAVAVLPLATYQELQRLREAVEDDAMAKRVAGVRMESTLYWSQAIAAYRAALRERAKGKG